MFWKSAFKDGAIWKEFEQSMILILMKYLLHIGLMLNVDWFNPFKKGLYSAGAIYLSILNLPRVILFIAFQMGLFLAQKSHL